MSTFAQQTPIHGVEWAIEGPRAARWFWSTALIIAAVGFSYQSIMSVIQYSQHTPSTTYTVKQVDKVGLPAVDVCVPYRFVQDKLDMYGFTPEMVNALQFVFSTAVAKEYSGLVDNVTLANPKTEIAAAEKQIETTLTNLNTNLADFIDQVSYNCEDFLKAVYVGDVNIDGKDACKQYSEEARTNLGHCTRFKPGTQTLDGAGSGKTYHFFIKPHPAESIQPAYDGVTLRIVSEHPDSRTIYVPFGSRTNVRLLFTRGTYLDTNEDPCEANKPHNETRETCVLRCVDTYMLPKTPECDCLPYDAHVPTGKAVCRPLQLIDCMAAMEASGLTNNSQQTTQMELDCRARCQQYCIIEQYTVTTTTMPLDGMQERDMNGVPLLHPYEFFIDVHHIAMMEVSIRQFPTMTFESLVANIGGLMSLWGGGSAIAIVHMCFFWGSRWKKRREYKKRKQHKLKLKMTNTTRPKY